MSNKDRNVVDMRWLADGLEDPHPRYIELPREDLGGAHLFSDDELANKLNMMSTISDEQDTAKMIDAHRNNGDYVCKSMLGEIAKDRIRWLSRRVAVLEGRYPGKTAADLPGVKKMPDLLPGTKADPFDSAVAESRLERQVPLLEAVLNLPKGTHPNNMAALLDERRIRVDSLKVSVALGLFMDKKPLQRWQIYVGLARDLLKHGIYIPFWDDEYSIGGANNNVVSITKSRYFGTGKRYQITKLATMEVPVTSTSIADIMGSVPSAEEVQFEKDRPAYMARAREIYDTWKDVDGWVPWVEGGNSIKQGEAFSMAVEEAQQGKADANN